MKGRKEVRLTVNSILSHQPANVTSRKCADTCVPVTTGHRDSLGLKDIRPPGITSAPRSTQEPLPQTLESVPGIPPWEFLICNTHGGHLESASGDRNKRLFLSYGTYIAMEYYAAVERGKRIYP